MTLAGAARRNLAKLMKVRLGSSTSLEDEGGRRRRPGVPGDFPRRVKEKGSENERLVCGERARAARDTRNILGSGTRARANGGERTFFSALLPRRRQSRENGAPVTLSPVVGPSS